MISCSFYILSPVEFQHTLPGEGTYDYLVRDPHSVFIDEEPTATDGEGSGGGVAYPEGKAEHAAPFTRSISSCYHDLEFSAKIRWYSSIYLQTDKLVIFAVVRMGQAVWPALYRFMARCHIPATCSARPFGEMILTLSPKRRMQSLMNSAVTFT